MIREDKNSTSAGAATTTVRPATVCDVPVMLEIINSYAGEQIMLARSPLSLYEGIRDFVVAERDGAIVGCGALHIVWGEMAEVRSIAVRPSEKGNGTGRILAERLLDDARQLLITRAIAFTYVPGFFEKLGFRVVEHAELPHKVFSDCLNCPKFNCCDEIAMLIELSDSPEPLPGQGPLSRALPNVYQGPFPVRKPTEEA